ncbi:bifunctional metallophosphatase/5'-nucleotidase [Amycolatopsis alkalitolerans]|uniref:Bifunctional metallophosphatase/5'-nucleotidase n=1 Tax=Amycolatopsis alkalitolerans TaxID=2547244 RepID=A0A5C4LU29_9PSEU|nr:bifunctional metallophosphatase/5'-nucleotidase [Amycolatopsis alkalitolerans]TNC20981.1 hypothetical protein FG385_29475 [Amycolatopsis alkalitolerans]
MTDTTSPREQAARRSRRKWGIGALATVAVAALLTSAFASARPDEPTRTVTLIHVADTHAKFVPHWEHLDAPGSDGGWHNDVGGFARTYTEVQRLRQQTAGHNMLLMGGDNFHGSAEMMFTKGRAGVPVFNKFAPDVYNPGNWDFAEGSLETRARFTGIPEGAPNATPGGKPLVTFPVVGAGVYNAEGAPAYAKPGTRLFKPYIIKNVNGVKVAVLGLNDDKPKDQGATFTIGLQMTAGFDEAPALVREVRAEGAEVVVAMSEAGLAQNVALARDVPGIDVVLSGDTHEEVYDPIRVKHGGGSETVVVESGEGSHVGDMELQVGGKADHARVVKSSWTLHEVDGSVPEDPGMKKMVDDIRAPFLRGPAFVPHTRPIPGGGKPMVLDRPLDDVIGKTDVDLQRHSVVPSEGDAFVAESMRELTGAQVGGTNGFRYDFPIPAGQPITVGDVYGWLPIGAHVAVAKMTGSQLVDRAEKFATAVLDPNPYRRGGGYLPIFAGARFHLDLTGPHGPTGSRIIKSEVYDSATRSWVPVQDDRIYTVAGCYSAGDALDRMCRTNGVRDMRFPVAGPDGGITLQPPLLSEMLPEYRLTKRAAPDGVISAPEALLRYLDAHHGARAADLQPYSGPTWVVDKGSLPAPSPLAPDLVQPLEGSGPDWLAAGRVG